MPLYTVTFTDPDGSGSIGWDVEAENEADAVKAFLEKIRTGRTLYVYSGLCRQSLDCITVVRDTKEEMWSPFKFPVPGEKGFRISIPCPGRYSVNSAGILLLPDGTRSIGNEMILNQGDQLEWDGEKWSVVPQKR